MLPPPETMLESHEYHLIVLRPPVVPDNCVQIFCQFMFCVRLQFLIYVFGVIVMCCVIIYVSCLLVD